MNGKAMIREAVVIILAAVVISGIVYGIRPDKIRPGTIGPDRTQPRVTDASTAGDPSASGETGPVDGPQGVAEISLEAARTLFDTPGTIFADARHELDFSAGHIQGARHLPADNPDPWLDDVLVEMPPETVIITYCDGDDCHLATDLAQLLVLNGFSQVYYLKNGWTRWQEKGFPVTLETPQK